MLGCNLHSRTFKNKGSCVSLLRLSFVLEVPLCNLHPSIINSIPCEWNVQKAYLLRPLYLNFLDPPLGNIVQSCALFSLNVNKQKVHNTFTIM